MKNSQAPLLNGKTEADKILKSLKRQIAKLPTQPGLAAVLVGNDKASKTYIAIKEKRAQEFGIYFEKYLLPASVSEKKIIDLIKKLNRDKKITGILLQLPLPKKFDTNKIISAIDVRKDVDGLVALKHKNIKTLKQKIIIPPTIQSILHLIKMTKINLIGKKAVILANSFEFATPLKKELEKKKMRVNILLSCHSCPVSQYGVNSSENLNNYRKGTDCIHEIPAFAGMTGEAGMAKMPNSFDVVIIALGKKHFLKPEMIKKNAIIIDVGINRETRKNADKKAAEKRGYIYGDVHPDCFKKSKYISPVPGGVGPLTVAYLFKNLMQLKYCKGNS